MVDNVKPYGGKMRHGKGIRNLWEGWSCNFRRVSQERTSEQSMFDSRTENGEGVTHKIHVGWAILDTQKCKCNVLKLEYDWNIPRKLTRPECLR